MVSVEKNAYIFKWSGIEVSEPFCPLSPMSEEADCILQEWEEEAEPL